ncbi:beta-N-acetylhexosaminidase [Paenibacillus sp. BC26]|uniref:beta-N-acetylhexosaminidase n=1 Tax=Paenibacillus sp. BC26 TaxID=1881032 RepID=UPI0008DF5457|nr:beta-N-acetylhexosaminidase [Paenibacillus sp. BC26]SFT24263.1 beta-N-acetylhexosaminidase [Paenibacillus sp. BC26]
MIAFNEEKVQTMLEKLSLKQKVALMCVTGVPGQQVTEQDRGRIGETEVGGLGLFPHNISSEQQLKQLVTDIEAASARNGLPYPALLSIDEEGGSLSNLTDFYVSVPGNRAIGLAEDAGLAYLTGKVIGSQLFHLGIGMDWAPVLDVNTNPLNPVIGVRSFHEDAAISAAYGQAFILGMHRSGVAATAKHFPGHGDVAVDSHKALPTCSLTLEQLHREALVPFKAAIEADVDAIMVAHVVFDQITEAGGLPASLSRYFVTELLRGELGYQGVICTDDIEMHAIGLYFTPEQAGVLAVKAGNDQVLMCHTPEFQDRVMTGIIAAVEQGGIPERQIDASVSRILALKLRMASYRRHAAPLTMHEAEMTALHIATSSIVTTRDPAGLLPLSHDPTYLLIMPRQRKLTQADSTEGKEIALAGYLAEQHYNMVTAYISQQPTPDEIAGILELLPTVDVVIQCTINAHMFREQLKLAELCAESKPHLCLVLRNPYDASELPASSSVVSICSTSEISMRAFIELHTSSNL